MQNEDIGQTWFKKDSFHVPVMKIPSLFSCFSLFLFETLCAICYHLCNLKNMKNTHGGVLPLVKACASTKSNTPPIVRIVPIRAKHRISLFALKINLMKKKIYIVRENFKLFR